jgi:uncharacterized membrane protein
MKLAAESAVRVLTLAFWGLLVGSLLAWTLVGYSWLLCVGVALPLLAPLRGLIRGRRYTYAWSSLFAVPYLTFAVCELLANPRVRWLAAFTLIAGFAWFCTMIAFLRVSRSRRE